MIDFKFDKKDCYKIPGLYRGEHERPFLAPVFFEKECLVNYFYLPQYKCQLCSETYGTIYHDEFYISFGINKNKKVIMWLGDLEELPENEQKYLFSFNIDSEHDIASEFYDSQINTIFSDPIKEIELLLQKSKINKKFGFKIFKNKQVENIDLVLEKCAKYKRIMFNNEDDFKRIISEWNENLIEDINIDKIKKRAGKEFLKELGGIKSLENLIKKLGVTENIIYPYYVLYDLRIWSDHSGGDDKYTYAIERLKLKSESSYYEIYKKLINEIVLFHDKLLDL